MAKERKLFLLVTEGRTDEIALAKPIETLINSFDIGVNVRCKVCKLDITITDNNTGKKFSFADPEKVEERIKGRIKQFLEENSQFKTTDILAVCSLHDLDACYCDDNDIIHHYDEVKYDLTECKLMCKDVIHIQKRNDIKRISLGILSDTNILAINRINIPYKSFYYSINLEHILANNPNITNKEFVAHQFRNKYFKNAKEFLSFLSSIQNLNNGSIASWDEKFLYKHPFARYSNLIDIVSFVAECTKDSNDCHG